MFICDDPSVINNVFFFNNVFVCACMMALPQVGGNINQVGNQLNDRQNVRLDPSAALVSE